MALPIKLNQLRAFVEVSRHGSIRAASRFLQLSQPALTKSIRELESSLGAKLFIRSNQGIYLTDCGESFLRRASIILEELRVGQEEIQQRIGLSSGTINIGVAGSIARSVMPKVIIQFHRDFPNIKIRIMEGQLLTMLPQLRQGELDFTVNTYYPGSLDAEFNFERLMRKEYKVIMRKDHPMRHATSLEQLANCDWTMPTPKGTYYKQLSEVFSRMERPMSFSVTCETLIGCMSLVAQSDFLTIVSVDTIDDSLFDQQFIALDLAEKLPYATFALVQRRDHTLSPAGEHLARLFRIYCHDRDDGTLY
ncbi:LysR family transcriptional regulator [Providencia thailandensis]|uniref:LysR family transcriptional regulator n=1 Tax=Providencia stuartii TaxID=588 RepID=A0AAJ1N452_PROST|nr:LysR family transcriptional regulator [Providencia thailandensis]MDE5308258.1 LysR family transcriptional regulator [Providencia stuartii]MDE8751924.1 LysR family transcriptional regulator [Providencia thailandensis]MDE8771085.1 LysR family transcriptional regulator [Providencia thailandensis]MDE8775391.1 LysR family transcriptional regulator [Providencia thailandensis]MDE8791539.1 LysR family transcriptional regulator [Providencia thailandensis]